MNPKAPIGPNHEPTPRPIPSVTAVISQIAFQASLVLRMHLGQDPWQAPARPMLKSTRVVAFWMAMDTASDEFTTANSTSSQPQPHSRRARSKIWSAEVNLPAVTPSVPNPTSTPQFTIT